MSEAKPAILECDEEQFSFILSALWRIPKGWRPTFFSLRVSIISWLATFLGIVLFTRKTRPFHPVCSEWIGAQVVEINTRLGSSGMSGCAFLGLKVLNGTSSKWLVFTLWGATEWLTINDSIIQFALSEEEIAQSPSGKAIDIFELIESTLTEFKFDDNELAITFSKDSNPYTIKVTKDGKGVLPWRGSGENKTFLPEENIEDCLRACDTWKLFR
jgi:hypothetical protein